MKPMCIRCLRKFKCFTDLQKHLQAASEHGDCARCRKGFDSHDQYLDHAALPPDASARVRRVWEAYQGHCSADINRVFAQAKRDMPAPTVAKVRLATGSRLDDAILSCVARSVLRKLPAWAYPGGPQAKAQNDRIIAQKASKAESDFVQQVAKLIGARFETEAEQILVHKMMMIMYVGGTAPHPQRSTPDMLFQEPTEICGVEARWIEYKNAFGFKRSPFTAESQEKQVRKYVDTFGPGVIVFKLGYEHGYLAIEGVKCVRERDVFEWLTARSEAADR